MDFKEKKYDPWQAPNPEEWLAMDEDDRVNLIVAFHEEAEIALDNVRLHSIIHSVVENQLALKVPEVVAAYNRLRQKKVTRHDAIHAIGYAFTGMFYYQTKGESGGLEPNKDYFKRLKKLKPGDWK